METAKTIKIISAVISLLLFLASIGGFVWSFFIPHIGMGVVSAAFAVLFGIFVYKDYQFFFE